MKDDSIENRLAALRPSRLPQELAGRLAAPPPMPAAKIVPFYRRSVVQWSAAAGVVLALAGVFFPRSSRPLPQAVSETSTRVLSVTPVTRVGQGAHLYDLVEVEWERETTIVSPVTAQAVVVQDRHRSLVPVTLQFD